MLDFSEKEFVELTNAMLAIFQEHFDRSQYKNSFRF